MDSNVLPFPQSQFMAVACDFVREGADRKDVEMRALYVLARVEIAITGVGVDLGVMPVSFDRVFSRPSLSR